MTPLRYTLLADGPADRCLMRVIDFVLMDQPAVAASGFVPRFADPRLLPPLRDGLGPRIEAVLLYYPCDLLFVHRDAEKEPHATRVDEIRRAAEQVSFKRYVPVVPVRMTQSWLLLDEPAIRRAADNPAGHATLPLPNASQLEDERDPKSLLNECLILASEKTGRHARRFKRDLAFRQQRVAEYIGDFSPLRSLSAFVAFEGETARALVAVDR